MNHFNNFGDANEEYSSSSSIDGAISHPGQDSNNLSSEQQKTKSNPNTAPLVSLKNLKYDSLGKIQLSGEQTNSEASNDKAVAKNLIRSSVSMAYH